MSSKKGGGHHGGAWKVAYADFVTAMMALFMVLWICAQDKKILLATSKYFKQPFNAMTDRSVGVMPGKEGGSKGQDESRDTSTAANLAFLNALASELNKMLNVSDTPDEKSVDMQVTSDGLKITLYDRTKHAVFKRGTTEMTEWGGYVMQNLAWLIDRNGLKVYIEGHTAAGQTPKSSDYGAWELSTDRANLTRRTLIKYAVNPKGFERVSGFGDTNPLPSTEPESDYNERITISLSARR
jgi:chemotaxis protein MotB